MTDDPTLCQPFDSMAEMPGRLPSTRTRAEGLWVDSSISPFFSIESNLDFFYFEGMEKANSRSFKLAVFDLDGTLTRERSIWEYIHKRLGKWYGYAEIYQHQFRAGEITYEEFCERDALVWKGMRVAEMVEIAKTVPFHSGADDLIRYMKQKGLTLSLVSSGLSVLSNWVHRRFGFDFSISNDLLHENGILTGKVKIRVHNDQKAEWVRSILKRFDLRPEESIAIGDSSGDLEMFRTTGYSIAFNSSSRELDRIATHRVESQNLTDIIPKLPF